MSLLRPMVHPPPFLASFLLMVLGSPIPVVAYPVYRSFLDRESLSNSSFSLPNSQLLSQRLTPLAPRTPEPSLEPPKPLEKPQLEPLPQQTPPTIEEDVADKIRVEKFQFIGNTAFSEEELEKALAGFVGREMTFAQLLEAEQAITDLYVKAGYINSGAVIEAGQAFSPEKAVVTITIVEGELENIEVTGTQRLKPDYIRSRLALATQKPFNQNRLLEALQLLQLDPLIDSISAQLSAGIRPDLSLLTVNVTEANSFSFGSLANNGRNSSVGSFRRGAQVREGNLLGFGDAIEVGYANTDGGDAIDVSYTLPVNPNDGTIRLAGGYSNNEIITRLFDRLNITGDYDYYELSFRQPILRSPTEELALGITLSRQDSQNFLLGDGFPLTLGADNNGVIHISTIRFFQDWVSRGPQDVFAFRSQFSFGLNVLDATINNPPLPDSRFFAWRGQGQYVRSLAPDSLLVVRSDIQLANKSLLSLEQFSLGGWGSVRGYPQDFLLTDNAFLLTAEVRLPIARIPEIEGVLQIIPFLDFGVGWNSGNLPNPEPNTLVGTGLGLQLLLGDGFSLHLDWGIPLVPIPSGTEQNNWNENGLYFSFNYNLF